ncbi:MAG: hypothetical protein V9E83_09850 [Baekduia sp.]
MSGALSSREQRIFEVLIDTLLAPAPPLPPVAETDAVAAFSTWLSRFPVVARSGMRAIIVGVELSALPSGRPWHAHDPADRLARLERLFSVPPYGPLLLDAVRAAAGSCYYGDRGVAAVLGYVPPRERA